MGAARRDVSTAAATDAAAGPASGWLTKTSGVPHPAAPYARARRPPNTGALAAVLGSSWSRRPRGVRADNARGRGVVRLSDLRVVSLSSSLGWVLEPMARAEGRATESLTRSGRRSGTTRPPLLVSLVGWSRRACVVADVCTSSSRRHIHHAIAASVGRLRAH